MKSSGFTLMEMLVVVLIIGILAAVALPQYRLTIQKTRTMRLLPLLRSISEAENLYYTANGHYTLDFDNLDISLPGGAIQTNNSNNISKVSYNDFECYVRSADLNIPANYSAYCNDLHDTAPRLEKYFSSPNFICWGETNIKKRICQNITGKTSSHSAYYFN